MGSVVKNSFHAAPGPIQALIRHHYLYAINLCIEGRSSKIVAVPMLLRHFLMDSFFFQMQYANKSYINKLLAWNDIIEATQQENDALVKAVRESAYSIWPNAKFVFFFNSKYQFQKNVCWACVICNSTPIRLRQQSTDCRAREKNWVSTLLLPKLRTNSI